MAFLPNIIIARKHLETRTTDTQRLSKGQAPLRALYRHQLTQAPQGPSESRTLTLLFHRHRQWGTVKLRDSPRAHSKQAEELEFNSGSLAPQPTIFLATASHLIQRLLVYLSVTTVILLRIPDAWGTCNCNMKCNGSVCCKHHMDLTCMVSQAPEVRNQTELGCQFNNITWRLESPWDKNATFPYSLLFPFNNRTLIFCWAYSHLCSSMWLCDQVQVPGYTQEWKELAPREGAWSLFLLPPCWQECRYKGWNLQNHLEPQEQDRSQDGWHHRLAASCDSFYWDFEFSGTDDQAQSMTYILVRNGKEYGKMKTKTNKKLFNTKKATVELSHLNDFCTNWSPIPPLGSGCALHF